jgi:hypothetical protein
MRCRESGVAVSRCPIPPLAAREGGGMIKVSIESKIVYVILAAQECSMAVFMVTWNLNKEGENYNKSRDEFIKQLKIYDHTRDEDLNTVYFISTTSAVNEICGFLREKMDGNDCLVVSKINRGGYQGWLSRAVWDWIGARL